MKQNEYDVSMEIISVVIFTETLAKQDCLFI